jgi:anti-sigma regulatory factor (Ser/Thr protein kinase)
MDAEVVVSELVSNAVAHASGQIHLELASWDAAMRITVFDQNPDAAGVLVQQADTGTGAGRGLCLVDALSSRWGVTGHDDGKSVWAEVSLADEPAPLAW